MKKPRILTTIALGYFLGQVFAAEPTIKYAGGGRGTGFHIWPPPAPGFEYGDVDWPPLRSVNDEGLKLITRMKDGFPR